MSFPWDDVFQREFTAAIHADETKSGFARGQWFKAGRGSGQTEAWWRENGPGMARAFGDWWEANPDARIWIAPDGRPGIELGLNVKFGDIPFVCYIDVVVQLGTALVVVDIKTSAKEPDNLSQLGKYACAVELKYGIRPAYGTHFMCRGAGDPKRYFMPPEPLDDYRYSIPYYTAQLGMLNAADEAGIFVPNPGDDCARCGVNYACDAVGGIDGSKYRAK